MINSDILDVLCPMHLVISGTGHVSHVGPTLWKMRPDDPFSGNRFLEVFAVKRPRNVRDMSDLRGITGLKLHLELRDGTRTQFKGVAVPAGDDGSLIVNLSFGISIQNAVREFSLTNADFAATDLAIEMLYLIEAKTAAMDAHYQLNQRLHGARVAAEQQADTDTLTGLCNRRALDRVLQRMVLGQAPFAVMQIDLDYFKSVNDTLGHAAGDHVLLKVAQIMVEETRKTDTVARVGGDEFTVVLPEVIDRNILNRIGSRIIERLEQPIPFEGHDCRISASIGTVCLLGHKHPPVADLLSDADVALYASKHAGRACQTFYSSALREKPATAARA